MAAPIPDPVSGDTFGRLTIKNGIPIRKGTHKHFEVVCVCGKEKVIAKGNLLSGRVKSCGCYGKEVSSLINKSHGKRKDPIYAIWNMMRQRCNLPSNKYYAYYGGRGIKVCERWQKFENFYADMGDPPFRGASLERVDSNGDYSKENVVWANRTEQNNNKRNSVRYEFKGEHLTLVQIADRIGMNPKSLSSRIYGQGMPIEDAVNTPIRTPSEAAQLAGSGSSYKGRTTGYKLYDTKQEL